MNLRQIKIKVSETDYTDFTLEDGVVQDSLPSKESLSNKTTSINSSSTNSQYPSSKATSNHIENNKSIVQVSNDILQFINVK